MSPLRVAHRWQRHSPFPHNTKYSSAARVRDWTLCSGSNDDLLRKISQKNEAQTNSMMRQQSKMIVRLGERVNLCIGHIYCVADFYEGSEAEELKLTRKNVHK